MSSIALQILLFVSFISSSSSYTKIVEMTEKVSKYPVPLVPGGRMAVHGWLILPWEQEYPTDPTTPVNAWFSHHTPEFFTDSPHDFQIILQGNLIPMSCAENETYVIDIPYPPASEMLVDEFTITPPPPFSLNDLLLGNISKLLGVVYNGSFDTLYERIPMAIATFSITQLTTAVYLNDSSSIEEYPQLRYYSYPRSTVTTNIGNAHYYFAHQIHAVPDYDQVIHTVINLNSCSCSDECDLSIIHEPGAVWEVPGVNDGIESRLMPGAFVGLTMNVTNTNSIILCKASVLEEIHCVVGPAFYYRC